MDALNKTLFKRICYCVSFIYIFWSTVLQSTYAWVVSYDVLLPGVFHKYDAFLFVTHASILLSKKLHTKWEIHLKYSCESFASFVLRVLYLRTMDYIKSDNYYCLIVAILFRFIFQISTVMLQCFYKKKIIKGHKGSNQGLVFSVTQNTYTLQK